MTKPNLFKPPANEPSDDALESGALGRSLRCAGTMVGMNPYDPPTEESKPTPRSVRLAARRIWSLVLDRLLLVVTAVFVSFIIFTVIVLVVQATDRG